MEITRETLNQRMIDLYKIAGLSNKTLLDMIKTKSDLLYVDSIPEEYTKKIDDWRYTIGLTVIESEIKFYTKTDPCFPKMVKNTEESEKIYPAFVFAGYGLPGSIDWNKLVFVDTVFDEKTKPLKKDQVMKSLALHGLMVAARNRYYSNVLEVYYSEQPDTLSMGVFIDAQPADFLRLLNPVYLAVEGDISFFDSLDASQAKNKFAVPSNSGSSTNQLIKQGWSLCDCADDILQVLTE